MLLEWIDLEKQGDGETERACKSPRPAYLLLQFCDGSARPMAQEKISFYKEMITSNL